MLPRTRTLALSTDLAAPADAVWQALTSPATLVHIARPLLRFPDLEGRTAPWRQGETTCTRLLLLGVVPLGRHRLTIEQLDATARRVQSDERSALVRSWRHLITVEPRGGGTCRYTDVVEVDAGPLTSAVATFAAGFYRWRQRRWRALARRHLSAPLSEQELLAAPPTLGRQAAAPAPEAGRDVSGRRRPLW